MAKDMKYLNSSYPGSMKYGVLDGKGSENFDSIFPTCSECGRAKGLKGSCTNAFHADPTCSTCGKTQFARGTGHCPNTFHKTGEDNHAPAPEPEIHGEAPALHIISDERRAHEKDKNEFISSFKEAQAEAKSQGEG